MSEQEPFSGAEQPLEQPFVRTNEDELVVDEDPLDVGEVDDDIIDIDDAGVVVTEPEAGFAYEGEDLRWVDSKTNPFLALLFRADELFAEQMPIHLQDRIKVWRKDCKEAIKP